MPLTQDEPMVNYRPETENLLTKTSPGPVKLAPGWESAHSNTDLVLALNKEDLDKPPADRCNLLFIIMLIHGIGILMPWNMFITAKDYFTNIKLNTTLIADTQSTEFETLDAYNKGFMGYVVNASQVPNVLCNLMNLFVQFGSKSLGPRIAGSIMIEVVLFVITVALAMVDSSTWPITFFFITMACVVIINAASGIYQNSMYGMTAKLPGKYTGALVLGTNISGTLTSLISIITTFASPSEKTAAIYYFISALLVLLVCIDTYFALPLLKIYRHYQRKDQDDDDNNGTGRPPYWTILKSCWVNFLNVFLCFYATLACFPAITADIVATDPNFPVSSVYYGKIFCFLFFNFFAMVGNIFPMWFKFPSRRFVFIPVFLRLLFIPFFMLCNYRPQDRIWPVYLEDYPYIAGIIVFALTHGYFSSLTMMYAPEGVHPKYAGYAGMIAAFFLVLGIFLGGNSIFVVQAILLRKKI